MGNIIDVRTPNGCQTGSECNNDNEKKMTNHGILMSKHPGMPCGPDTIVGKGGVPAKYPLAL
jgi:hypothetical protein